MNVKKKVAEYAVVHTVKSEYRIGLGSGSTALYCVASLARLLRKGTLKNLKVAASSLETLAACYEEKLPVYPLDYPGFIEPFDVVIDGADEIDTQGYLIKGGGGAHVMEKIIAEHSKQFIVIADSSKLVDVLGNRTSVPVEVIPSAYRLIIRRLNMLGGNPILRAAQKKLGPVITEQGNVIIDVRFAGIEDPPELSRMLHSIPGVVDHGIFVIPSQKFIIFPNGNIVSK